MSINRREFLQYTTLGTGALMAGSQAPGAAASDTRPNILVVFCDQLGLDAIAAHGCADARTPNIDRLVNRGVTFLESHSTNPVCSPARSSVFTGRMPVETGVITNDRPIHDSVPDMGQWLRRAGYETAYCGKWHLPHGYPTAMKGFDVLPVGAGQGDLVDVCVGRSCEAWLKNRSRQQPFLLVTSFMQPHDICYWAIKGDDFVPPEAAFPHIADRLPDLPPNHTVRPRAPEKLDKIVYKGFSDEQWRYYLYIYYRQVEMLDTDLGRVLDALDDSGQAENTIIIFTADHGDGRGRHSHVSKWYPYDESVKVPLIFSCPGRIPEGVRDTDHLVSGIDIMGTVCDYASCSPPPDLTGRSLKPLIDQQQVDWREFVAVETHVIGRTLRTSRYKYVHYEDDPLEQLFDMREDPWETKNLYDDARYADTIRDHRRMLAEFQAGLKPVEPTPSAIHPRKGRRKKA